MGKKQTVYLSYYGSQVYFVLVTPTLPPVGKFMVPSWPLRQTWRRYSQKEKTAIEYEKGQGPTPDFGGTKTKE